MPKKKKPKKKGRDIPHSCLIMGLVLSTFALAWGSYQLMVLVYRQPVLNTIGENILFWMIGFAELGWILFPALDQ